MIPKLKPKIIESIDIEDKIIGKVAGINLKNIDLENEIDINAYIKSIKKIIDIDFDNIYIEGQDNFNDNALDLIQKELNLKIDKGYKTKIYDLPIMIKNIFRFTGEDIREKEVLIILDNVKGVKNVIEDISKQCKFISIYGLNDSENDDIYEYILEQTGLSVFCPVNLENVIKNYSLIINLSKSSFSDKLYKKIKRSTIIFDFGENEKKFNTIQDFGYKLKDFKLKEVVYLNKVINSSQFHALKNATGIENIIPKYIISGKHYYSIEEYITQFIRFKGKF